MQLPFRLKLISLFIICGHLEKATDILDEMTQISRDWIHNLENKMRAGQIQQVRQDLRSLSLNQIPRPHYKTIANLARRSGLPTVSIRVMRPIVYPQAALLHPASGGELAEYAAALTAVGALEEARSILDRIKTQENPEAYLYRAFTFFPEWNYSEAIPWLQAYLALPNTDAYQRLVVCVNLIASYLHESHLDEAKSLLNETLARVQAAGHKLLHGNLLELSAQEAIAREDWSTALERLDEASTLLADASQAKSALFVRKWKAIVSLHCSSSKNTEGLIAIRNEAIQLDHWETVRDCDFHLAILTHDENLARQLWHGTPSLAYQARLVNKFPRLAQESQNYQWNISGETHDGFTTIDLAQGTFTSGRANAPAITLEPGQLPHQLLASLCRDFYRPQRVGSLISRLYKGEHFDPVSSVDKLHQVVSRLREWFNACGLPLTIKENGSAYRLISNGAVIVRLSPNDGRRQDLSSSLSPVLSMRLDRARKIFGAREFVAHDLAGSLDCSLSSATRLLREAKEAGQVQQIGRGPRTRFKMKHAA